MGFRPVTLNHFCSLFAGRVLYRGPFGATVRCPVHGPEEIAWFLHADEGDDGHVELHCEAGCSRWAIMAALGRQVEQRAT
jgi:hypothetical protein